jgi:hypothetical protein
MPLPNARARALRLRTVGPGGLRARECVPLALWVFNGFSPLELKLN